MKWATGRQIPRWAWGLTVGLATPCAIYALLAIARLGASKLPTASRQDPPSPQAAAIYRAMESPAADPTVILRGTPASGGNWPITEIDPYSQIVAMQGVTVFLLALALGIGLTGASWAFSQPSHQFARRGLRRIGLALTVAAAGIASLAVAINIPSGRWDEVFVFASQAQNFVDHLVPAVRVSGPVGWAESSADALGTHLGGALLWLWPVLQAETALTFGYIMGSVGFLATTVLLADRWFHPWTAALVACACAILLLPQSILTLAATVPTVLATSALACLGVALLHALCHGLSWPVVGVAIGAAWARWEFGLLALVGLAIAALWHRRQGPRQLIPLCVLLAVLMATALIRLVAFGSPIPSGVVWKRVGTLDGAFLTSGLDLLQEYAHHTYWPVWVGLLFSIVIWVPVPKLRALLTTTALVALPAAAPLVSGGDWFPIDWTRYIIPSLGAATMVAVVALTAESAGVRGRSTQARHGAAAALLVVLVAGSALPANSLRKALQAPPDERDNRAPRPASGVGEDVRTDCLARTGALLGTLLPPHASIATSEVNTLAYFARRPVTDVGGLVDPRSAWAPFAPLYPGNTLLKRTNPSLIGQDQPTGIYLADATCDTRPVALGETAAFADLAINSEDARYRFGPPKRLNHAYIPVVFTSPRVTFVMWWRKNDVPVLASRSSVHLDVIRRP